MDRLIPQRLAEITGTDLSSFEAHFQDQMLFVVILYGVVFVVGLALLFGFTLRIQSHPLDWDEPVRRLAWRPWNLPAAMGIVVPLVLIQVVFALAYYLFRGTADPGQTDNERVLVVVQSLLFHWACFLLIGLSLHLRRLPWTTAFGLHSRTFWRDAGWGVAIMVGVMPLLIGYNFVAQMVMQWMGYEPPVQDVTRIIFGASDLATKIYFALLAVVVAPVVEEMLFRGILLPALTRKAGVKPAIVTVSLLFAAVHGHLPSAVPLFILSAALSLGYIYRGSLVTSIAMHSFFNSMTIAVIMRS